LRVWEALLGLLKEGGVDGSRATWSVDLLTLYVTAVAAEQSNWRASGHDFGRVKRALLEVTAEQFPLVHAAFNGPKPWWDQGQTPGEGAVDVIIDGIVSPPGSTPSQVATLNQRKRREASGPSAGSRRPNDGAPDNRRDRKRGK